MNRHGVVVPREDGVRARCMGPEHCHECALDMFDAPRAAAIKYLVDEVARRWSQPNADLTAIIASVVACWEAMLLGVRDTTPRPVTLSIELVAIDNKELQFLGALVFLGDHFEPELTPDSMARAAGWLALKYGAMR